MQRIILWSLCLGLVSAVATEFSQEQCGKIAQVVGEILSKHHYASSDKPLDDKVSKEFLKNYFDTLDYNHLFFYQSDFDQYANQYGSRLDDLIRDGDVSVGFEIFNLYLKRLAEQKAIIDEVLTEKFDFNQSEGVEKKRHEEPWPLNASEAKELWRQRVKSEILQDRLSKINYPELTALNPEADSAAPATDTAAPGETSKSETAANKKKISISDYDDTEKRESIAKRYNRLLKNMEKFDRSEILEIYLSSLSGVYDPHSNFMSPEKATNFDIHSIKLSLTGIGAVLTSEDGYTKIVRIMPGGPAETSGLLHPNDRIIAVAQGNDEPVDVIEEKLNKVVDMIRGEVGTKVRLTIIPASGVDESDKKEIVLVRDVIEIKESLAKAKVIEADGGPADNARYGVINLPQFYENCASDVDKIIQRLKQESVNGIILDLRRNGGGILDEAINLTGLFVKSGPVVQVQNSYGAKRVMGDRDGKVSYEGPLVVLVSQMSASASEIVAAALQDYGRALVVGDQTTHGKGTVQTLYSLEQLPSFQTDSGKLKFTVSKFYRIAGGTTQKYGVKPDIILPSVLDYMELGEAHLPNSLEADQTSPTSYQRFNDVAPVLGELKKRSDHRVKNNQDFSYILQDIDRIKKQKEEKFLSLNERERLLDKVEIETTLKERKSERAKRQPKNRQVFELTLEAVNKNEALAKLDKLTVDKEEDNLAAPDEEAEEETAPEIDVHLEEALSILRDYVDLRKKILAVN